jgi:alpha-beta hydrolase superfamily lysophospholipase
MRQIRFVEAPFRAMVVLLLAQATPLAAPPVSATPPAKSEPGTFESDKAVERFDVEASDGVSIAAWHYPVAQETRPLGIVVILHDIGGSHLTVEPLARALQAAGCAVVAPDLRGHGASRIAALPSTRDDQARLLKKSDFEMMAGSGGGRIRTQSAIRGDVECLRNWIVRETKEGRLPKAPLFVVGSGLGAVVGAHWVAADAAWPDSTSGPQGREVAGLVMISPPFTVKGFTLAAALANDAVRHAIPVLVIAGKGDREGEKVFDQLKRQRPKAWYDARRPPGSTKDASPVKAVDASLMLVTHPGDIRGDDLAAAASTGKAGRAVDPATAVPAFMRIVTATKS